MTQERNEMAAITIRLPQDTIDGIKRVADREYRSMTAEIRRVLEARIAASDAALKEAA